MTLSADSNDPLTPQEQRFTNALRTLSFVFAALGISYLAQGVFGHSEFPFVANSTTKDLLFAALAFVASTHIRRNGWAADVVIAGHVLLISSLLAMLAFGDLDTVEGSFDAPVGIGLPSPTGLLLIWLGLASAVTIGLAWMRITASRSRYHLRYLAPHQFLTAAAFAEVLVDGDSESLTPEQVATGIDRYLDSFRATQKWKSKLALSALTIYPILRLQPPPHLMSPSRRRDFISERFLEDVFERRLPEFLRRPIQAIFLGAQQLVMIGYYADPRSFASTGYVPFSMRPRAAAAIAGLVRPHPPLDVRTPAEVDATTVNADVVIVGSGAAGSILAHRLAEKGREVLILERGPHIDPATFVEDERSQFSNLFADGGLQVSTDSRFQVLQAMCVGGATVVNNAVCFRLPDHILDRWNDRDGLDAGLDPDRLAKAFDALEAFLPISKQTTTKLGAGSNMLAKGITKLGYSGVPWSFDVVSANISDCVGCGYCNIGCPFGKKLSALDSILPRAQALGADAVRIYSQCSVERIGKNRSGARQLRCRFPDGRQLDINANTVVVAGGALASSLLLQRSNLGGSLTGRNLGFNMGAPMTGEFEERLNSFDGLQIAHHLRPPGDDGLIVESWFNPVGTQAMFMPGWFETHYANMRRYSYMACAGSVVGTARNARVKTGCRGRGMKLDYVPTANDLSRLVDGLELIGQIYLAAGAIKVMPTTYRYIPISRPEDLHRMREQIADNTDVQLHSAHPQGGNALSRDPAKGVVNENFELHGAEDVYVCDASVFPCPITVNPQLTIMALAHYAADTIA